MSDKSKVKERYVERYPKAFPKSDKTVPIAVGTIVVSRAGRDKYRAFIITAVPTAETHDGKIIVEVADGKLRKVEKPKPKNISHLIVVGRSEEAAEMINAGTITNSEVQRIIEAQAVSEISYRKQGGKSFAKG